MKFEFDNNIPIYLQLVDQLKTYIISGKIKPGDRLPSVRELALKTKVNPNTLQKALLELEESGLIFTERTNGKFVTTDQVLIDKIKYEYVKSLVKNYFDNMRDIGFNNNDAIEFLKQMEGDKK